jgi:hypothetical protein
MNHPESRKPEASDNYPTGGGIHPATTEELYWRACYERQSDYSKGSAIKNVRKCETCGMDVWRSRWDHHKTWCKQPAAAQPAKEALHDPATGEQLEKPSWAELGAMNEKLERCKAQLERNYAKQLEREEQFQRIAAELERVKAERDELCINAQRLSNWIKRCISTEDTEAWLIATEADAAIAKAEGRAQKSDNA